MIALADDVAAGGPLDILINNAARPYAAPPGAYAPLVEAESRPARRPAARDGHLRPDPEAHPRIAGALRRTAVAHPRASRAEHAMAVHRTMTALALRPGTLARAHAAGTAIDAGGLVPDLQPNNSWTQTVGEVDPLEMLEVQLCNSTAPFLLVSRLRPALAAQPAPPRRTS